MIGHNQVAWNFWGPILLLYTVASLRPPRITALCTVAVVPVLLWTGLVSNLAWYIATAQAVMIAAETGPDVILMDIRMPGMDGITATERILAAAPGAKPRVVVLTTFDLDEYVYAALRVGASGFLLKETEPRCLRSHPQPGSRINSNDCRSRSRW